MMPSFRRLCRLSLFSLWVFFANFSAFVLGFDSNYINEGALSERLQGVATGAASAVLVGSIDGTVHALDSLTGTHLWSFDTGGPLLATYQVDNGLSQAEQPLMIPGVDGSLVLFGQGGLTKLPLSAQEMVAASPFSTGDQDTEQVLVIGSKQSEIFGLSAETGAVLGSAKAQPGENCPPIFPEQDKLRGSPPLWLGRSVYSVRAYDRRSGLPIWNLTYSTFSDAALPTQQNSGNAGSAAGSGGGGGGSGGSASALSVVSSSDGWLRGVHALTGRTLWETELSAPAVAAFTAGGGGGGVGATSLRQIPVRLAKPPPAVASSAAPAGNSSGNSSVEAAADVFVGRLPSGQLYAVPVGEGAQHTVMPPPQQQPPQQQQPSAPSLSQHGSRHDVISKISRGTRTDGGGGGGELWRPQFLPLPPPSSSPSRGEQRPGDLLPPLPPQLSPADDPLLSLGLGRKRGTSYLPLPPPPPLPPGGQATEGQHGEGEGGDGGDDGGDSAADSQQVSTPTPVLPGDTSLHCLPGGGGGGGDGGEADGDDTAVSSREFTARCLVGFHNLSLLQLPRQLPAPGSGGGAADAAAEAAAAAARERAYASWRAVLSAGAARHPAAVGEAEAVGAGSGWRWWLGSSSSPSSPSRWLLLFAAVNTAALLAMAAVLLRMRRAASAARLLRRRALQGGAAGEGAESGGGSGGGDDELAPGALRVGRLLLTPRVLGYGSHGTMVFEGRLGGRRVAVKRMLRAFYRTAQREVRLLIRSDGHPSVLRYFAMEGDSGSDGDGAGQMPSHTLDQFVYLALELCHTSLADAVSRRRKARLAALSPAQRRAAAAAAAAVAAASPSSVTAVALPSPSAAAVSRLPLPQAPSWGTRRFLLALAQGVAHLHSLHIVHRDLKPHNVLLAPRLVSKHSPSTGNNGGSDAAEEEGKGDDQQQGGGEGEFDWSHWQPKISDMGLGKKLETTHSSFGAITSHGGGHGAPPPPPRLLRQDSSSSAARAPGTVGWQAPELLLALARSRALGEGVGGTNVGDATLGAPAVALPAMPAADGSGSSSSGDSDVSLSSSSSAAAAAAMTLTPRASRAVDVFSLGCLLYFVLDDGGHPFGEWFQREHNIMAGALRLSRLRHLPCARALLRCMLSPHPAARPSAHHVTEHPLLWSDAARLAFLCAFSDHLESLPPDSALSAALEAEAAAVVGPAWDLRLAPELVSDAGRHRRYNFGCVRDLLRLIRNKQHHYRELPLALRTHTLGALPGPFLAYFAHPSRFPLLLIHCYRVALLHCTATPPFTSMLGAATVQHPPPLPPTASQLHAWGLASPTAADAAAAAAAAPTLGTGTGFGGGGGWCLSVEAWVAQGRNQKQQRTKQRRGDSGRGGRSGGGDAAALARERFKTRMCAEWAASSDGVGVGSRSGGSSSPRCPRGDRCDFAHGVCDLRISGNYKTSLCREWARSGGVSCPRGVGCDYAHGVVELRVRGSSWAGLSVSSSSSGVGASRVSGRASRKREEGGRAGGSKQDTAVTGSGGWRSRRGETAEGSGGGGSSGGGVSGSGSGRRGTRRGRRRGRQGQDAGSAEPSAGDGKMIATAGTMSGSGSTGSSAALAVAPQDRWRTVSNGSGSGSTAHDGGSSSSSAPPSSASLSPLSNGPLELEAEEGGSLLLPVTPAIATLSASALARRMSTLQPPSPQR